MHPRTSEAPPVGCGGRHLARGAQEAEKTHVAPFATHLSYALENGTAEDSMTMRKDLGFDILAHKVMQGRLL